MVEAYYLAGAPAKASQLGEALLSSVMESAAFFLKHYEEGNRYFESCYNILAYLAAVADDSGDHELASSVRDRFNRMLNAEE